MEKESQFWKIHFAARVINDPVCEQYLFGNNSSEHMVITLVPDEFYEKIKSGQVELGENVVIL